MDTPLVTVCRARVAAVGLALMLLAGCASGGTTAERTGPGTDTGDPAPTPAPVPSPSQVPPSDPDGNERGSGGTSLPGRGGTGRAPCTDDALGASAGASRPGARVSLATCNAAGSRAVASVEGGTGCTAGCTGYFVAEGTRWTLVGVTGVDDPLDAGSFGPWRTLHASWRAKLDATRDPENNRIGAVAGSGGGQTTTTAGAPSGGPPPTAASGG